MISFKEFIAELDSDETIDEAKMTPTQKIKRDMYLKSKLAPKIQKYISIYGKAKARSKMNKMAFKPLGEDISESEWENMSDEDFDFVVENYELLSELSKSTLVHYIKRASKNASDHSYTQGLMKGANPNHVSKDKDKPYHPEKKEAKRHKGIALAAHKLAGKRNTNEDIEALDELSLNTLNSYKKKAENSKINAAMNYSHASHSAETLKHVLPRRSDQYSKSAQGSLSVYNKRHKGLEKADNAIGRGRYTKEELAKEISAFILETIITNNKLTKEEFDLIIDDLSSILLQGDE